MVLTEANIARLCDHTQKNVDWRYPQASGSNQYDFNPGTGLQVIRYGEPVNKEFPTILMNYSSYGDIESRGLGNVLKDHSGSLVYGYIELNPLIITIYTHTRTRGSTRDWHGKIVAGNYRENMMRYMRRQWPRLLQGMEASIYNPFSWKVQDLSEFMGGTERQGFEITMYIQSTQKWDYAPDGYQSTGESFEDANLYINESGLTFEEIISLSGIMATGS